MNARLLSRAARGAAWLLAWGALVVVTVVAAQLVHAALFPPPAVPTVFYPGQGHGQ